MKEMVGSVASAANALLASTVTTQQHQPDLGVEEAAVPPSPHRRGRLRVREVSSRFMSPLVVSNSNAVQIPTPKPAAASESHRSKSAQRRQQPEFQEVDAADRNCAETARSLDSSINGTPLLVLQGNKSAAHKKLQQQQRGKPPSSVVNKENDSRSGTKSEIQQVRGSGRVLSRPDTPIVNPTPTTAIGTDRDRDRVVPSRYRHAFLHQHHRPTSGGASTPAAKLLQDATKSTAVAPPQTETKLLGDVSDASLPVQDKISKSIDHHPCASTSATPHHHQGNYRVRSSMSEVDHALHARWHGHQSFAASPTSRSLNFRQLNTQNSNSSWISLTTDSEAAVTSSTPPKPFVKNIQAGSFCLPPHPQSLKLGGAPDAARKGRKLLFNHQEDVHSLKLLYNHYLQWRFANAKAEASMVSQKMDTERQLYSLGVTMSDMRDLVKRSRIELQMLQRIDILSTIAEYQMPYLDEWSAMEENYATSLCSTIDALRNLSLRLPVSDGVKIGATELGEILDSAEKLIELIVSHIESYMVKAEEVESLTSEIARVVGRERAHIHDCGDSLLKVYASQVEECSLRGHLIQLHVHNQEEQKNSS